MKIGLIGAGRLGICLALLIEQEGYHVIASDVREDYINCLLYTSPSPRDLSSSRMPSSA